MIDWQPVQVFSCCLVTAGRGSTPSHDPLDAWMDGGNEVWSEASDDSHSRHQSTPHCCLSSINVSIHQSISAACVFHLCICPFLILPILLCLHLHVLHLSNAQPYPPSFCHFRPSICSSSILPFVYPSIHQLGLALCFLQPGLVRVFIPPSLCPYISPSATLLPPLITPSRRSLRLYFSLLSVGLTVHCQTTEDTVVAPCCHCLRLRSSFNLFSFSLSQSPPVTGAFHLPLLTGR